MLQLPELEMNGLIFDPLPCQRFTGSLSVSFVGYENIVNPLDPMENIFKKKTLWKSVHDCVATTCYYPSKCIQMRSSHSFAPEFSRGKRGCHGGCQGTPIARHSSVHVHLIRVRHGTLSLLHQPKARTGGRQHRGHTGLLVQGTFKIQFAFEVFHGAMAGLGNHRQLACGARKESMNHVES